MSQQYFGSSISLLTAAASAEVQCVPTKVSPSSSVALEADANVFQSVPYFDPLQTMAYLSSSPLSLTACKRQSGKKTTQDVRIVVIFIMRPIFHAKHERVDLLSFSGPIVAYLSSSSLELCFRPFPHCAMPDENNPSSKFPSV